MAERRIPRPPHRRAGAHRGYQDWQIAQGIPQREALDEARRREDARDDAQSIRTEDGFDADLFFGHPSYAGPGPDFNPEDGWKPLPDYIGRAMAQQLSGAEVLRADDGSPIAYRMPGESSSDDAGGS
jgi:hypothetical protein